MGVSWVVSNFVRNHLFVWEGFFGGKAKKKNAVFLPHAIFGAFGMKEIGGSLRGVELPLQCFKDNFIKTLCFCDNGNFVIPLLIL